MGLKYNLSLRRDVIYNLTELQIWESVKFFDDLDPICIKFLEPLVYSRNSLIRINLDGQPAGIA